MVWPDIVGAEFKFGKYIKLSPNFRLWSPKTGRQAQISHYAYLNASFSLIKEFLNLRKIILNL